jgi:UDP-glucose 4-epimerase
VGVPSLRRVVVTGASGNVGSALLDQLVGSGTKVLGLCRRPPAGDRDGVDWRPVDLTTDEALPVLREAFAGADAVVHLAWGFQPSHRLDHLEELGVGGTRRVLDTAAETGVPHVVHMSSVGAYAPRVDLDPVDESWSTQGVPTSPYSTHKAAAERHLDRVEAEHPELVLTRLRPGIIGQRDAGSALLRYALPGLVPASVLRLVPLLPLDRRLVVPMVHALDVADAIERVLERRVGGAFNLAAEPVVTSADIAEAFGARVVPVPARLLRGTVAALWHARLLQLDPGWIDLAYAVPLLDTTRARTELDWRPTRTGPEVLDEVVAAMSDAAHGATPVLRRRSLRDSLASALTAGPVHRRARP